MKEKLVRCLKTGFQSIELEKYVKDKLIELEEKTSSEGLTSFRWDVVNRAFESQEVQALIGERKEWHKAPEPFIQAFRVDSEIWFADIPFDVALSAIDKELSGLYKRYGVRRDNA